MFENDVVVGTEEPTIIVVPIHEITIRTWELDENSTTFDRFFAAPSAHDLNIMWRVWAIISLLNGTFVLFVMLPIIFSKATRSNPFNIYLIFIMLPDVMLGFACGTSCLSNISHEKYSSEWNCKVQTFYIPFALAANVWMNAVIVYRIHTMLCFGRRCRRYFPPSPNRALFDSIIVYLYSAFVASFALWGVSWMPLKPELLSGSVCAPFHYENTRSIFRFFIYFPLTFFLPFMYIVFVGIRIYKQNLLPQVGKRRLLTVFFFRLAIAFIAMWTPTAILFNYLIGGKHSRPWTLFVSGLWGHFQGGVGACITMLRPDIMEAIQDFWCCCCYRFYLKVTNSPSHRRGLISKQPSLGKVIVYENTSDHEQVFEFELDDHSLVEPDNIIKIDNDDDDDDAKSKRFSMDMSSDGGDGGDEDDDDDGDKKMTKEVSWKDHMKTSHQNFFEKMKKRKQDWKDHPMASSVLAYYNDEEFLSTIHLAFDEEKTRQHNQTM